MSTIINTNTLSLLTQNNLNKSQSAMNTAIQRLSSGLRINSAKDDAAGQAIANRFTSTIKGLTQAQRNANDGISLAQTTEGALNEVNTNLQRIRELTVQSANGSNSNADKASIQAEITQRLEEIDRTSKQTDFNGVKVLSSVAATFNVQVGANDGETISIGLQEISSNTLGLSGFNVDGKGSVANEAATADKLVVAGFAKGSTANANSSFNYTKTALTDNTAATASNVLSKLANAATANFAGLNNAYGQAATGNAYVYDSAAKNFSYSTADISAAKVASVITPAAGAASVSAKIEINGTSINVKITNAGDITTAGDKALFIDKSGNLTETTAGASTEYAKATVANLTRLMDSNATTANDITVNSVGGPPLTLTAPVGIQIGGAKITMADGTILAGNAGVDTSGIDVVGAKISSAELLNAEAAGTTNDLIFSVDVNPAGGGAATSTVITVSTAVAGTTTIKASGVTVREDQGINAGEFTVDAKTSVTTTYVAQTNGNITDTSGAKIYQVAADNTFTLAEKTISAATVDPLKALDVALSQVDKLRGTLGAVQTRFDSVISNLGTTVTNLSASRSRIEDADYATEVSNMTRAQILQQAGTSVLAKANQSTQGVLSLLQ